MGGGERSDGSPSPFGESRGGALCYMSFPFYIARRYLFSKKSANAINVISAISVVGIAVASMALVIVLSVFNGFHDLAASFLTKMDPQLKIVPAQGKTAPNDDPRLAKVKQMDVVDVATECVEDQALAVFEDHQAMVYVKGVDENFDKLTGIRDILYGEGEYELKAANLEYGILGIRLAQDLGTTAFWRGWLKVYAPTREGQLDESNLAGAFSVDSLLSPGVLFAVNQSKYDKNYIITSTTFARNLFGLQGRLSSLELKLKGGVDTESAKRDIRKIVGPQYRVLDRMEQQADTFRIMQIEKFIAYIFLTFILIVACFNIIGSVSMLIIDKKNDVQTLRSLGATDKQVRQIFLFEGRIISAFGAIVGIAVGLLLCWLQQRYGLVAMGDGGSYIVNAYPVSVHYSDVFVVLLTVIAVGWIAVWYPVRYMSRRLLAEK